MIGAAPQTDLMRQAGVIHQKLGDLTRMRQEAPLRVDDFVGVFYGQMLQSMRQTLPGNPVFGGGRAEEVFSGQLDQEMGLRMAKQTSTRLDQNGAIVRRHNPLTEDFMRSYNRSLERQADFWASRLSEVEAALSREPAVIIPDEDAFAGIDRILSDALHQAEDMLIKGADRVPVPMKVSPEDGRKLKLR